MAGSKEGESQEQQATVKRVTVVSNKEELVASTPNERNWRGILIALLVIVAVLGLIVFSIVLLSPPDEGPRVKGRKFTLEDILGHHFQAPRFNGTWVSDSELVYRNIYGGVTLYNADNLTATVLMTNSTFRRLNAVDFAVSNDLKYILLISNIKKVFKYSFEAVYSIYEIETANDFPLTPPGIEGEHQPLQHVVWAPEGNALAFVYRNDIYYKPRAKEKVLRLTDNGEPGVIFNGVPDWLYEEEIFRSNNALWFSPDSKSLLFATFNDSSVGELKYPWYGSTSTRLRYPQIRTLRYPKAGTANPTVTVSTISLAGLKVPGENETQSVIISQPLRPRDVEDDSYVTAITWATVDRASVVWMNRKQNVSVIAVCRHPLWKCDNIHTLRTGVDGWAEITGAPIFSTDGNAFITRLPVLDGDNGYFQHACQVDVTSKRVTPLTNGPFDVTHLLAWDEDNHFVYFEAAPEQKPSQRHLFRVGDVNATASQRTWECLSCSDANIEASPTPDTTSANGNLSNYEAEPTTACLFSRNHFPRGSRFYVQECLGPDVPVVTLMELPSNVRLSVLDGNGALRERFSEMARPQIKMFQVELDSGYTAQVRLYLPPGLREYEEMQFPMVLQVDASPGSQLVTEEWVTDWATYLASSRNFIVAQIDGRGSGFQGEKILHEIHNRLGSVEIEDQIGVIKYLRDNLKFVDKTKVAVWGWSYGGYATAMILAQDTGIFHCGIAVAPVTSWAHYDSVFSERYMGVPADNYRFYEESDVTKRAGNLKDKLFLLIHGTADDTVHYQQSMLLVKALTKEGVLFRHQTYPDEGHTFSGVQDHFYRAMESFLDDCFGPLDFLEWEVGTSFFTFKQ